jgi:hypothetical protein
MITDIVWALQSVSGLDQSRGREEEVQEGRGYEKEKSTSRVRVDATLKSLSTWH